MAAVSETGQDVADAARAMGVTLAEGQAETLVAYMEHLQRWNRVYNLTALRDPRQILVQHVLDSLSVVAPMRAALTRPGPATIVDVGSGGGLPGVVIAATNPDWRVFCVDAVEKKTAFVRQMRGALGLSGLHAVHGRIESLAPFQADIVVSRAFASLADFASLAGGHVAAGGCLLAMKGRTPEEEIRAGGLEDPWTVERIEPLTVPGLDARRCLVWMRAHQGTI